VPRGLTFRNSTFCSHSVFMCFVRISKEQQRLFPYKILTGSYNRKNVFTARYKLNIMEQTNVNIKRSSKKKSKKKRKIR
jgi:hypothetical protein